MKHVLVPTETDPSGVFPRSNSGRLMPITVAFVLAMANAAFAGPGTGGSLHHDMVFEPMARLPRYVRVSDGADCVPFFQTIPNLDFQLRDDQGASCVPAFVREGDDLAELNGVMNVATCTSDLGPPGDVQRSIDLFVDIRYRAIDNPGILTEDLALTPLVYPSEQHFDPDQYGGCNGVFGGPGPVIPNSGWASVVDASCANLVTDLAGLVSPPLFDEGPPPSSANASGPYQELTAAAPLLFDEIVGYSPVPMLLDVSLDAQGNVTGTQEQSASLLGAGPPAPCAPAPATLRYEWTGWLENMSGADPWGLGGDGSWLTPSDGTPFTIAIDVAPSAPNIATFTQTGFAQFAPTSVEMSIGGAPASPSSGLLTVLDSVLGPDELRFSGDVEYNGVSLQFATETDLDTSTFSMDGVPASYTPPAFDPTPSNLDAIFWDDDTKLSVLDGNLVSGGYQPEVSATSNDYGIVVRFAQPAGYTPPAPPAVPVLVPIGALVLAAALAGTARRLL